MGWRALHRPAPPPPGVSPRNYIPLSQPLNETTRPAESRQLSHPESRPPVFYLPLNLPLHLHISCPPSLPPYPQPESISHLTQLDGALSIGGALFANVYLFFSSFFLLAGGGGGRGVGGARARQLRKQVWYHRHRPAN